VSRLLIAGTSSGCGKTTLTCALLSALRARGLTLTAFKCGPDYIDPMFHRAVYGIKAYNLDPFFLDGEGLRSRLAGGAGGLSILEGAMGYYDGIANTDAASAYTVARETDTPVVLTVSAKGAGHSLAAMIEGFARHRPDSRIKGVIFNDADERRYPDLTRIAEDAGLRAYGFLPRKAEWVMPSRNLGLLPAGEIGHLKNALSELGRQAEQSVDLDGLIALAGATSPLRSVEKPECTRMKRLRLAVARDEAFCFLYEENLELLSALGCEPVFFSPLRDKAPPPGVSGLYLCGGYPELHAKELSENRAMIESIRRAINGGLPTVAECGGFLYLHESLDGVPMCGVIPGASFETERLQRFGYITITAERDNVLCDAGASIRAHEFHYWDSDSPGSDFTAQKAGREQAYPCVHATDTLYAGFPHLYFPANPGFAERFAERMNEYEP
jgi:cobyrinic acid a,c-diamide synthase